MNPEIQPDVASERRLIMPPDHIVRDLVRKALAEDIGVGDLTTQIMANPNDVAEGVIVARAPGVVAGLPVAAAVFEELDPGVCFSAEVDDGTRVEPGGRVARISGPARAILSGERVALNFLQQLSGVVTAARAIVEQLKGTNARLLDTRKTVPGLRPLQRYAVRIGGGTNHRYNLFDGVLIKENHILVAGGVTAALQRARASVGPFTPVEIEVETLEQLREAIEAGADMVLLDNMSLDEMRQAVEIAAGRLRLEASGDITVETAREIAETGVDFLSSGAITHSAPALNLSLRLSLRRR
ncbi:MAG: carboxylating nicotinate-nucleotide diphosphorylase [Chloroflexota bacterium]